MSDLAILAADTDLLDRAGDPATFVVLACERAKDWLTQAVEHGDIDQIVELKSQAEAIRIYTTQKQLGKDAELAAAEIVRRAERGIGVAIRRGQEEGTIRGHGGKFTQGEVEPPSPSEYATRSELHGNGQYPGLYDVTDDVTDEQFEEAITKAKDEKNLSRANVVRKVKGEGRHELLRNTRHIDPNRVVEQTILGSGLPPSLAELLDYSALDRDRLEEWISSLSDVIRSLTNLRTNLKKELTQ
ncbi:MAG: hypothetical protein LC798_20140 [Chloroflexi bacterium]|nr:hypothetical protein [Chloroflexota bacterium]